MIIPLDMVDFSSDSVLEAERQDSIAIVKPIDEVFTEKKNADLDFFRVPFYSQFDDISLPEWRKVGCGIASLAMLIEYYEPESVTVDELLQRGIDADAFLNDAGWTHSGLINLSKKYGLTGESHDLSSANMNTAFATLEDELEEGPVMASVHYTFDPQSPIPHIVVVSGVSDGKVFYNDPSERAGGHSISIQKFQSAWKKRYIDIRPIS
jgi:ABC-type bacteriocin/lantibiotic exporter with double-glycine peptidase domain